MYLLAGTDVMAARFEQSPGDFGNRRSAVMAEKIARFIGALRMEKPASASDRPADVGHPLLWMHRTRLSSEQAQRLGEFALQFLH